MVSDISRQPIRRIEEDPSNPTHSQHGRPGQHWPTSVPAVAQLLASGIDLAPVTVLVGENGAGKSTIVEAVAEAFGLNVEGGTHNALHSTQRTESGLSQHLRLMRGAGGSKKGVFLRAETMHGHFAYQTDISSAGRHNFQSHGESFIEFFTSRATIQGLWVFDEAESALSFNGCLALVAQINELVSTGSQVLMSTHSPILASIPGARIYELGDWGIRRQNFDDLEMVRNYRSFLDAPERYLRHLA